MLMRRRAYGGRECVRCSTLVVDVDGWGWHSRTKDVCCRECFGLVDEVPDAPLDATDLAVIACKVARKNIHQRQRKTAIPMTYIAPPYPETHPVPADADLTAVEDLPF